MKKFILKNLVRMTSSSKKGDGAIQFDFKDRFKGGSKVYMIVNTSILNLIVLRMLQKHCLKMLKKQFDNPQRIIINSKMDKFKFKTEFIVYCSFRIDNKRCTHVFKF